MKKKVLTLLVSAVMAFSLTACGGESSSSSTASNSTGSESASAESTSASSSDSTEKRTIGIATYTMDNTAIYPLLQAMIDTVTAHGDDYVFVSANGDSDTEGIVQSVEELVTRDDIDAIAVDNINDTVLYDVVAKANEKGIPIAFNDIPFASDDTHQVVTNVVNDNYGAGVAIAEQCVEDLGGEGNVILFTHEGNSAVQPRTQGIHDVLEQYPDINILYEGLCTLDVADATSTMEDLLMAHDDIDAVLSIVDNQTIGNLAAIKAIGREGIKLYSIDGGSDICPLIKDGSVEMSVAQDFVTMGTETIEALYAYMDGEEVEDTISCEAPIINSDNVDEWIEFFENTTYDFAS